MNEVPPRGSMQLSPITLALLVTIGLWFGLDFIGVSHVVDREPLVSLAGLMLALLVVFFVAGLLRARYVALIYTLSLVVWLWLQVATHWGTYVLRASERKLEWYERAFGGHFRILPALQHRTTPDGYHTILALLILVNLGLAIRDILRRAPQALPAAVEADRE